MNGAPGYHLVVDLFIPPAYADWELTRSTTCIDTVIIYTMIGDIQILAGKRCGTRQFAGWQTVRQRDCKIQVAHNNCRMADDSRRQALEERRGSTTMHDYNFDYIFGSVTVHDNRRNRRLHYRYVYVIYWDSPCLGLRACQNHFQKQHTTA